MYFFAALKSCWRGKMTSDQWAPNPRTRTIPSRTNFGIIDCTYSTNVTIIKRRSKHLQPSELYFVVRFSFIEFCTQPGSLTGYLLHATGVLFTQYFPHTHRLPNIVRYVYVYAQIQEVAWTIDVIPPQNTCARGTEGNEDATP